MCQASLELGVCVQLDLALERGRSLSIVQSSDYNFWFRFHGMIEREDIFPAGKSSFPTSEHGLASMDLTRQLVANLTWIITGLWGHFHCQLLKHGQSNEGIYWVDMYMEFMGKEMKVYWSLIFPPYLRLYFLIFKNPSTSKF